MAEILIASRSEEAPTVVDVGDGVVVMCSRAAPHRASPSENEDAAGILLAGAAGFVMAVADGVGGSPAGGRASSIAVESALEVIRDGQKEGGQVSDLLVRAFDAANQAVLAMGNGSATTLTLAAVSGSAARICNVGDSEALVTGQRGRVKFRSISHSPVGYAVEAGLLDEAEALMHEERHVVSNTVGSSSMSLELGAPVTLALRDTLVLGSDGLFDNLLPEEVVDLARTGSITTAVERLTALGASRMTTAETGVPSKPDDLTLIVFRPHRARSKKRA